MHRPLSVLALAAVLGACSRSSARDPAPAAEHDTRPVVAEAEAPVRAVPPRRFGAQDRSALAPVDERWVEETLRSLSLREKVGQMVLAWTGGRYDPGAMGPLFTAVERDGAGGIIISIGSPQEYVTKLNALQRRARIPLLVITDMESGPGMRLTGSATDIPPAMGLAATGSDTLAFEVGRVIGIEGRAVGLHLTLSPVLDVNSNPNNPIINTRSYGEDPAEVGRYAAAYVRGVHAGGLLAMGKHFPGHGDTHTDSHIELPRIDADRARLDRVELPPFQAAVHAGIDGMLVGHIAAPRVTGDGLLASLDPRMTTGILREQMGFRGLVSTDAMNMGALTRRYGQGDAAVRAITAGADILLQPTDIPGTIRAVVAAVGTGRLTEARIDQSVRRILAAKSRARLQQNRFVDAAAMQRAVGNPAHRRLADSVAARSITLVRDRRSLVPLAAGARRILSVTYSDRGAAGGVFNSTLGTSGRSVESVQVSGGTSTAEFARIRGRAASADLVVVSAYVTPREYRGSVETGGGFAAFVEELARANRPVVAVSFGSPYLLRSFPSVPAYVLAWGSAAVSQEAAARALLGQAPVTGRLPVTLSPQEPRGHGLRRGAAQ